MIRVKARPLYITRIVSEQMKKTFFTLLLLVSFFASSTFAEGPSVVIGISQFVRHPSMDAIRRGILDYLSENGYAQGKNVTYDINVAGGDFASNDEIAARLAAARPDLIITLTTPSAQAMVKATSTVPVLFCAVVDPVGAGLVKSLTGSGTNVTGMTFVSPVREQFELFREIMPGLKRMGFVYNPKEENAVASLVKAREAGEALGIEIVEATVSGPAGVRSAAETLVGRVDAVYLPIDNTVASAFDALLSVSTENGLPVFSTAVEFVDRGAVAARAIDSYQEGKKAGKMAVEILEGKDPGKMPIEKYADLVTRVNLESARKIGLTIPESVLRKADKVIGE
jgi:putative ABC transport system substrate-binding protein